MNTLTTHRDWMKIGQAHYATEESKARLIAAAEAITWQEIPPGGSLEMPMCQGLAIKEAIKALRLPKVSHVAESSALAPYALLGIRAHYANGTADIFIVDEGSRCTPVFADFTPVADHKEHPT